MWRCVAIEWIPLLMSAALVIAPRSVAMASSCTVPTGADCGTLQAALNQAGPGDTIQVAPGVYFEKVHFPNGGSAGGGYVTLQGAPGHASILDGTGVAGSHMIRIDSKSYVKVLGLEIRNNLNVNDGSGIRIVGAGSHVEIRDNRIHDMRGQHAMGITVYGTQAASISHLIIDGNEIYDCEPAPSEALTLNGNVELFEVTNNVVRDVNNIGIDFIGGETDIQPDPTKVARNGVCRGNVVARARSSYGGGYAGAIYVDGGRDILIERNIATESDLGLEVGAENSGTTTRNITVRNNVIYRNDKVGLVFGGYAASVGRVVDSVFTNNTLYDNDTLGTGVGEIWIQYAQNCSLRNNLVVGGRETLLYSEAGNVDNHFDYNLWHTNEPSPSFVWNGVGYASLAAFRAASGEDMHGLYAAPQLVAPGSGDFHLQSTSPAVDAGDPSFVAGVGETDWDGAPRVSGDRVDIGADEVTCGDGSVDQGEACDDGNPIDCDGCDSNCTDTATCGNGIICGAEQCDDANVVDGDCCSSACAFEAGGSPCSDGHLCTNLDACDGLGGCAGVAVPSLSCRATITSNRALLQLKRGAVAARNQIKWKWAKGEETLSSSFGDPRSTADYALCLYDASLAAQPVMEVGIPAGSMLWRSNSKGFKFKDLNGTSAGATSLQLVSGVAGRSAMSLQGKGALLPFPALPLTAPVTVQLGNRHGECWGASFGMPTRSDAFQFKAKSD